jgi:membrane protease YdiL (CAAX protease family)
MTSPEPSPPGREPPVWSPFAALAIVVVAVSSFQAAALGIAHESNPDDFPLSVGLAFTVLQDLALVFAAWLSLRLSLGHAGPADLGLRRVRRPGQAVLGVIAVYVVFLTTAYVLARIFGTPPDQQLVKDIKQEKSTALLAGFAVMTCLVAPVAEELFFRAFMFRAFAARLGPVWGALLCGAVFGLVHAPNPVLGLIALAVLGVGLCALYWRFQSIIPCMALHALNNSITFGLTVDLDGGAALGLVAASVGLVVIGASAVSARPAVAA